MDLGNALTGFMQGFDPNRDFMERWQKQQLANKVKAAMETKPTSTTTYKHSLGLAAPEDMARYNAANQDFAAQDAATFGLATSPESYEYGTPGMSKVVGSTPMTNYSFMGQTQSSPFAERDIQSGRLNAAADIISGVDPMRGLEMRQRARNNYRDEVHYDRKEAEYQRGLDYRNAYASALTPEDRVDVARKYGNPGDAERLHLEQLDYKGKIVENEMSEALRTGGLDGITDWYSKYDNGMDFKALRSRDGSVVMQHIDQNTGKVVEQVPMGSEKEAIAWVMAQAKNNPTAFIELARLEQARNLAHDHDRTLTNIAGLRASAGDGAGVASMDDKMLGRMTSVAEQYRKQRDDAAGMLTNMNPNDPNYALVARQYGEANRNLRAMNTRINTALGISEPAPAPTLSDAARAAGVRLVQNKVTGQVSYQGKDNQYSTEAEAIASFTAAPAPTVPAKPTGRSYMDVHNELVQQEARMEEWRRKGMDKGPAWQTLQRRNAELEAELRKRRGY